MSVCRSCAAPVLWAKTTRGRSIPLDAEPVPKGNLAMVADGGRTPVVASLLDPDASPVSDRRYVSHFATCPKRIRAPEVVT